VAQYLLVSLTSFQSHSSALPSGKQFVSATGWITVASVTEIINLLIATSFALISGGTLHQQMIAKPKPNANIFNCWRLWWKKKRKKDGGGASHNN
jgi:hypothetical protein